MTARITALLQRLASEDATDLHLSTGKPPILRIDGQLVFGSDAPLTANEIENWLTATLPDEQRAALKTAGDCDLSVSATPEMRARVNAFRTEAGPAVAIRRIPTQVPSLSAIGTPAPLARLARHGKGLILVTGPTGSGKSTTLAAMIQEINATSARHIITIEDPIEYVHPSRKSLINQREIGRDAASFQQALRAALREDPDVLLVGEMRDLATISLALTAAETGHLVLATLHTASAAKAVDRIVDVFPPGEKELVRAQLATSLAAVVAQLLLPARGGGRVAAFELMLGTPAIRNLVREGKAPQIDSMIKLGQKAGMQTLRDHLDRLVEAGQIEPETAAAALNEELEEDPPASTASGNGSRDRDLKRKGGFF